MNKDDIRTISKIAARAVEIARKQGADYSQTTAMIDLEKCHAQMPLDLDALLAADNFNFTHDVFGIANHIDRETGIVGDCFVPRYARRA